MNVGPGAYAVATEVFSDVNENVMLGVVTGGLDNGSFEVNEQPVRLLTDERMPNLGVFNAFGFEVDPASITVGSGIAIEGYYATDTSGILYVWDAEVNGGDLADPGNPQISIQRYRCSPNDLRLQGGLYPVPRGNCPADFTGAGYSLEIFNVDGTAPVRIPFELDGRNRLNVIPDPEFTEFCSYSLRVRSGVIACPADVRSRRGLLR